MRVHAREAAVFCRGIPALKSGERSAWTASATAKCEARSTTVTDRDHSNVRPVRQVSNEQQLLSARRYVQARATPFAGRILSSSLGGDGVLPMMPILWRGVSCLLLLLSWVPEAALVGAWTAGLSLGMRFPWLIALLWQWTLALIREYRPDVALYATSCAVMS